MPTQNRAALVGRREILDQVQDFEAERRQRMLPSAIESDLLAVAAGEPIADNPEPPSSWRAARNFVLGGLSPSEAEAALTDEDALQGVISSVAAFAARWRAARRTMDAVLVGRASKLGLEPSALQWGNTNPTCFAGVARTPGETVRLVRAWYEAADRPNVQGSSHNVPVHVVAQILRLPYRLPLWAVRVLAEAKTQVRSLVERPGSRGRVLAACRTWRHCPGMPQRLAHRLGQMPPLKRAAGELAWRQLHRPYGGGYDSALPALPTAEAFWERFRELSKLSKLALLGELGNRRGLFLHLQWGKSVPSHSERKEWETVAAPDGDLAALASFPLGAALGFAEVLQANGCLKHDVKRLAARAARLFGKRWKEVVKHMDVSHDAFQALPSQEANAAAFADHVLRYKQHYHAHQGGRVRPTDAWWSLCRLWGEYRPRMAGMGPVALLRALAEESSKNQGGWGHLVLDPGFGSEVARWHAASDAATFRPMQARWLGALATPPLVDPDRRWEAGPLVGRFLPRNDPRGLFLGEHTGCCQHPRGAGAQCAWHGHESPLGGFFVVEDGGEIVAQSWVWVAISGALVFDSIETNRYNSEGVKAVYQAAFDDLAESPFGRVLVGAHSRLGDIGAQQVGDLERFADYSGYTDAGYQWVAAHRHDPVPPPRRLPVEVFHAVEADLQAGQRVADLAYPGPDGDYPTNLRFVSVEEGCEGLLLKPERAAGSVEGYAVFHAANREVLDLAITPKFQRTRSAAAFLRALVAHLRLRGEGEWTASCRPDSLRLLQRAEQRGQVKLRVTGSDGDQTTVAFEIV